MKAKDHLKYLGATELFKIRDAVKILMIYFDLSLLKRLQEEISKRLEQLQKEE